MPSRFLSFHLINALLRRIPLRQWFLRRKLLPIVPFLSLVLAGGMIGWIARTPPPKRTAPRPKPAPVKAQPLRGVTVVLDPGHGGIDSGYRRRDCREDALNYRFAATLASALTDSGAHVLFTVESEALKTPLIEGKKEPPLLNPGDATLNFNDLRVSGTVDALHRRAAFTRAVYQELPADDRNTGKRLYFISIHHDAYSRRYVRGGHILYDKRSGGPPQIARVLARRLSEAGLARKNRSVIPNSDARHLGVLNPSFNPIPQRVLIEVATITNPKDRDCALSRQWRWRFAHLIADALVECEQGANSRRR